MAELLRHRSPLAKLLIRREEEGRNSSERSSFNQFWDMIAKYTIPREAIFVDKTAQGHRKDRYVVDSTAPRSLELFAAFMFTSMNNPTSPWADFDAADTNLTGGDQKWLDTAARRFQRYLGNTTDLYNSLHENYLNLGAFGGAVLLTEKRSGGGLLTQSFSVRDCTFEANWEGEIDTIYRLQEWTRRQALSRFRGRDIGKFGEKDEDNKKLGKFLHCVVPAYDDEVVSLLEPATQRNLKATGYPYVGIWVNAEDGIILDEGLYKDFPYSAPRWYKTAGETYGRSPAMTVIGDILMVNRMSENTLKGAEKLVDPPLMMPQGGLLSPVRMFPGGITYTDGPMKPEPVIPPGASRIELGSAMIAERQSAIRDGFFVPLFVTPDSPVKTATQVLQETDERNRATAPMTVRMHKEHFNRFMPRLLRLSAEQGLFQDAPENVARQMDRVNIVYNSPIVSSVSQNEGLSLMRLFEALVPWAEVDRGAFDSIDVREAVNVLIESSGVPKSVVASATAQRQKADARAQADQQAALMENGADIMKGQAAVTTANKK